jgi:hypothetical protein
MKTWMLVFVVVGGVGCATTAASEPKPGESTRDGREGAAEAQLRAVLEALPTCEAGAQAGMLSVAATTCTKMFCGKACCNQCSWSAQFEGKSAVKVPVENARVRELLKVSDGALDCEIGAWAKVLAGVSMAVEGTACVVR